LSADAREDRDHSDRQEREPLTATRPGNRIAGPPLPTSADSAYMVVRANDRESGFLSALGNFTPLPAFATPA
jgi:hypothetical protein